MFLLFYCNSIPLTSVPDWRKAIQKPIVNLYQVWITFFEQRFCPFDDWPLLWVIKICPHWSKLLVNNCRSSLWRIYWLQSVKKLSSSDDCILTPEIYFCKTFGVIGSLLKLSMNNLIYKSLVSLEAIFDEISLKNIVLLSNMSHFFSPKIFPPKLAKSVRKYFRRSFSAEILSAEIFGC